MSIWKKIGDLAHKSLSDALDRMENKSKLRDQALLDFAEQRQKAQNLLIKAMAQVSLMEQQLHQLREKIARLLQQAQDFLQHHDEPRAKEILTEKQRLEQQFDWYQQELHKETAAVFTIKRALSALDEHISAYTSQSSVATSQDIIEQEDAFQTFARMEEKISSSEYEIAALKELIQADEEHREPTPKAFDTHSDPKAIEQELAALKKKLP